jgi:hypothetical protein
VRPRLAKESKNLANQIGEQRPDNREQPEEGDDAAGHLGPQKMFSSAGLML